MSSEQLSNPYKGVSHKAMVLAVKPDAFCRIMDGKIGGCRYIIWPGKIKARGFEEPALALGRTSGEAWRNACVGLGIST